MVEREALFVVEEVMVVFGYDEEKVWKWMIKW